MSLRLLTAEVKSCTEEIIRCVQQDPLIQQKPLRHVVLNSFYDTLSVNHLSKYIL